MKIKIRHIDEADAVAFDECTHDDLPRLIDFIKKAGGVHHNGADEPFHSFQLVLDEEAYAEIIVGQDNAS